MTARQRPFPLMPLLGAGGLMLVSLLSVAWLQWFAEPAPDLARPARWWPRAPCNSRMPPAAPCRLSMRAAVQLIAELPSGQQGFVRATVRGLARARRARGLGAEVPFTLEQRASGQLLLIDPLTGQEIDLWAFGSLNAQPFTEFLQSHSSAGNATGASPTLAQSSRSNSHD